MTDSKLRIGLIQMVSEKGAVAENLRVTAAYLAEAAEKQVDIVAFPEGSISGFINPIKFPEAVLRLDGPEVTEFLNLTEGLSCTVMAGVIEENGSDKPYITQVVARNGKMLGFYRKRTIENEEVPLFSPGILPFVFDHRGVTVGTAICADIDNVVVFADYAGLGARIVFEMAAPGLYGEQATRNWQTGYDWWEEECLTNFGRYASAHHLWIAVATQAGRTVDEDFPGGGFVFGPDGRRLFATVDWSAGGVYLEIDLDSQRVSRL
ncbi:MAG: carbon-nitrogen hydrolase family protein [Candidatus Promineifilaceae bacterium]